MHLSAIPSQLGQCMYTVHVSVFVSPLSSWIKDLDLVFGERMSSWIGWWSCAPREINQSTMWEHLAVLYAACLTDSSDTWKPSERARYKSHCCSTGPCIMQEALSLSPSAPCSAVKIDQQTWAFSFFLCFSLTLGSHQVQRLLAPASHFFAWMFVCRRVSLIMRMFAHTFESVWLRPCVEACKTESGYDCYISLPLCTWLFIKSGMLVLQWFLAIMVGRRMWLDHTGSLGAWIF